MKRFRLSQLDHLRSNDFLRHNMIMFIGNISIAGINYLYYPIVGRLLSTNQFGETQALVSLFLQIVLLLNVIADVSVNIIINATNNDIRNEVVYEFERLVTFVMAIIVVIALLALQPIKHFLHINNSLPVIVLGATLVVAALVSQRSAFLRGMRAYGQLSIAGSITACFKLITALAMVLLGFGVTGAVGGLLLAQLITMAYVRSKAKKLGLHAPADDKLLRLPDMKLVRPHLSYALLVLIVSIVTTVFFSIDVILVKHYFSGQMAGEYAGVATIARIVYFVTGSVAMVLLSAIELKVPAAQNRKLFLRSLGIVSLIGGGVLALFFTAPRFFIHLMIGSRYLPMAGLLPRLSLTLFMISIVNLIFSYDVALRRWSIGIISVIGIIGTVLLVSLNHSSPVQVVNALLLGSILLLGLRAADSFRRNILHFGPGRPQLPL